MLRFVTHKLKTQSLNEVDQPFEYKSDDDDRDSGTESDDENTEYEDSKEAAENDGVGGKSRSRDLIQPSRPANFDEETSTGSPDDLHYTSSTLQCGGTFHDLATSRSSREQRQEDSTQVDQQSQQHSRSRRVRRRSDGRYHRAVDRTSDSASATTRSLSHVPSPVSSSMLDVDSALPSDSDHFENQSSEDELDTINSGGGSKLVSSAEQHFHFRAKLKEDTALSLTLSSDDEDEEEEALAESVKKTPPRRSSRRFANDSQIKYNRSYLPGDDVTIKRSSNGFSSSSSTPYQSEKRKWSQANRRNGDSSAGSSDEEVRDLMYVSPPVEFCTSPPAELIRPMRSTHAKSTANLKSFPVSVAGAANNNNNGNLISSATNFSAFSYISVSLPCSPSPFLAAGDGLVTARSPPAKLFHFSSSNFLPFEVCAVSPRKRHRQSAGSHHHHHYPHQAQFQPTVVESISSEPQANDANQPRHFSISNSSANSINHTSNNIIINQFNNTPTNGYISNSSTNRHSNASQRNGSAGVNGTNGHPQRQRPCLDFEKMQQVRSRQMSHSRRRCRN